MRTDVNTNCETFSHNVIKLLKAKDISKKELAKKIGVGASTVTGWVNGRSFARGENMRNLAELLGVTPAFLRGEEEAKASPNATSPLGISPQNAARISVLSELCGVSVNDFLSHLLSNYGTRAAEEMKPRRPRPQTPAPASD